MSEAEPRPIIIQLIEAIASRNLERSAGGEGPVEEMWLTREQHAAVRSSYYYLTTEDDGNFMGVRIRVMGT